MEKKKALIIGAGKEALHTIEKAKQQGLWVAAMDGNPQAEGLDKADEGIVEDISDEERTIAASRKVKPDFLLTVPIGRYLTTAGAVNDALDLPGIGKEEAVNCTDKWRFHQLLEKEGLRSCICILLTGKEKEEEIRQIAKDFPYPGILKPRYGSGSRGVFMVHNIKEFTLAWETIYGNFKIDEERGKEDYLFEECAEGEEYGIDAAVIGGKLYLILLRKKENTPFPNRQAVAYFSVSPEDSFYHKAKKCLQESVRVLGLQECLLHGDLICHQDSPFVIELSARPSGHNLHNLFTPLATGIDMAERYIRHRKGEVISFHPPYFRNLMIHYFDVVGRVGRIPTKEEAKTLAREQDLKLIHWECSLKEGEIASPVVDGHSLMGRGFYILEKEDSPKHGEDSMKKAAFTEAAKRIRERFRME